MDAGQQNIESKNIISILKGKLEDSVQKQSQRENESLEEINKLKNTIEIKTKWAKDYVKSFKENDLLILELKKEIKELEKQIENGRNYEEEINRKSQQNIELSQHIDYIEQNLSEKEKKVVELVEN